MNNIIFIDTAMSACSVGVYAGGTYFVESEFMECGQAEAVLPMVQEVVMDRVGIGFDDLDVVITTVGPGGFTGLRVGLSVAKSLALVLDIPVFGVTSFQALAFSKPDSANLAVLIESKRKDFYVQAFGEGVRFLEPSRAVEEDIVFEKDMVFVGDGTVRFQGVGESDVKVPDPRAVIEAFLNEDMRGLFSEDVQPLYLREADVSKSKKKQRVLAQ